MELRAGDTIFQTWKIKNVIGKGSFGTVYEIERNEFGHTYYAAAKVIEISKERFYSDDMLGEEATEDNYIEYYRSLVEDVVEECALMERMKGDSHIVSYEDHQIEQKKDGSWMIYIRMELLKPLRTYMAGKNFTNRDVIQLGIDLCMALESCQKFNVIHRDIKPENIFVSETGSFKLGDFGISKALSVSEVAMSKKGTQLYMAPEVYKGEQYNSTVDIYSLGLVLFRLMNDNRLPFFPLAPEPIRYRDNKIALQKRLSGLDVPVPCNASGRLGEIIQKACKYEPSQRYSSSMEMRRDLEAILYNCTEQKNIYSNGEDILNKETFVTTMSEKGIEDELDGTIGVFIHKSNAEKKIEEKTKKEEQQRQEEERKRKELQKEEKRAVEEEEQKSEEDEEQKSEIDKLLERKKIDLEIKERALRQQQRFLYKSEEDAAKQLMVKKIEEKRRKEEKKNRKNRMIAIAILLLLFIIIIIVLVIDSEHKAVPDSAVSSVVSSYIENFITEEDNRIKSNGKDYATLEELNVKDFSDDFPRVGNNCLGYITVCDDLEIVCSFNPEDEFYYSLDSGLVAAPSRYNPDGADWCVIFMYLLSMEDSCSEEETYAIKYGNLDSRVVLDNILANTVVEEDSVKYDPIIFDNHYKGYELSYTAFDESSMDFREYARMFILDDPDYSKIVHVVKIYCSDLTLDRLNILDSFSFYK